MLFRSADVARQRDDAILAGLQISLDALRHAAARQQDRAHSERGRLACAAVIDAVEAVQRRVFVEVQ